MCKWYRCHSNLYEIYLEDSCKITSKNKAVSKEKPYKLIVGLGSYRLVLTSFSIEPF